MKSTESATISGSYVEDVPAKVPVYGIVGPLTR